MLDLQKIRDRGLELLWGGHLDGAGIEVGSVMGGCRSLWSTGNVGQWPMGNSAEEEATGRSQISC